MAGYSGTPLIQKLGLRDGQRVRFVNPPPEYGSFLGELPPIIRSAKPPYDFIHFFVNKIGTLERRLPQLRRQLDDHGMIWVSWYKKASRQPTELTEDIIRATALAIGLVDVKVCAVSDEWSGLKLVVRRAERLKG